MIVSFQQGIYFEININIQKSVLEAYDTKPITKTTTTIATNGKSRRKRCLSISPTMRPTLKNVLILSTQTDSNKPMVISFDGEFHSVFYHAELILVF